MDLRDVSSRTHWLQSPCCAERPAQQALWNCPRMYGAFAWTTSKCSNILISTTSKASVVMHRFLILASIAYGYFESFSKFYGYFDKIIALHGYLVSRRHWMWVHWQKNTSKQGTFQTLTSHCGWTLNYNIHFVGTLESERTIWWMVDSLVNNYLFLETLFFYFAILSPVTILSRLSGVALSARSNHDVVCREEVLDQNGGGGGGHADGRGSCGCISCKLHVVYKMLNIASF